jgi:glutaredoxin
MLTVYGADWCEDTQRSLRHLRRLSVRHRYINIDEDLDALERAKSLNGGRRRTPVIDLAMSGPALVEPDNDTLTGALVEIRMLTADDAAERMSVQNVGDFERLGRLLAGIGLAAAAVGVPRSARGPLALVGGLFAATGVSGWCPVYHATGMSSLGGPGDRPDEATRRAWLARREPLRDLARVALEEHAR